MRIRWIVVVSASVEVFVEQLDLFRMKSRLGHAEFAREVGISPELWRLTRTGKRPVGISLLRGVLQRYPSLEAGVVSFLRGDVPSHNTHGVSLTKLLQWIRGKRAT